MKVHPHFLCALCLGLLATSCETGPRPPEPGTPAFYWGAALETYKAGDLAKTNADLQEVLQSDNDFTARARIFQIAVSAGMARGAEELGSAYEAGIKLNRNDPGPLRRRLTQVRAQAGHSALDLAQQVQTLLAQDKSPQISLEFPFPPGSAAEPPALQRLRTGMIMPDADADTLEAAMLEKGVVEVVCRLAGSADDTAKALQVFQQSPVRVTRETFLLAAARILNDEAVIFTQKQLDQPQRLRAMYQQALAALGQAPESKDTKALTSQIQAAMKKLPGT